MTFNSAPEAKHEVLRWMRGESPYTAQELCDGNPSIFNPSQARKTLYRLGRLLFKDKLSAGGAMAATSWVHQFYRGDAT